MEKNHNYKLNKIISIFIIYFALNFISWALISGIWRILNYLPFELLIFLIKGGLPIILIFSYILTVHNKNNNIVLLQIAFILFPLLILLEILIYYNFKYFGFFEILHLSLNLLLLVGWVLNIISLFKGFLNSFGKIQSKYILYITFLITSTVKLTELIILLLKYRIIEPSFIVHKVILFIATLLVYFSLFIFFKNNNFSKNKIRDSIERELISLNQKLYLKIITEEEFQEKRKDIINNI